MKEPDPIPKMPPVWLVRALNGFRNFLITLNRNMFPGNMVLYEQFQQFWLLPSLYVAAKLDVAGHLKETPLTLEELAEKTGSHAPSLYRILRALASEGIFKIRRDGRFALNNVARGLLDEQGSLRYMLLHHLGPVNWNMMSQLETTVKNGEEAFLATYQQAIYDYLRDHPAESEIFSRSMSNLSDISLAPILQSYHFSVFKTIADIGGGEGFLLANILRENSSVQGILFDVPEMVTRAPAIMDLYGVSDRMTIRQGDFFEAVPASADLYILKNIIHNWNDADCTRLLRTLHHSMHPGAKILIIEMIVSDHPHRELPELLDIQMLATMPGGKERTRCEFRQVLDQAGFALTRIIRTIAPLALIEAKPKG